MSLAQSSAAASNVTTTRMDDGTEYVFESGVGVSPRAGHAGSYGVDRVTVRRPDGSTTQFWRKSNTEWFVDGGAVWAGEITSRKGRVELRSPQSLGKDVIVFADGRLVEIDHPNQVRRSFDRQGHLVEADGTSGDAKPVRFTYKDGRRQAITLGASTLTVAPDGTVGGFRWKPNDRYEMAEVRTGIVLRNTNAVEGANELRVWSYVDGFRYFSMTETEQAKVATFADAGEGMEAFARGFERLDQVQAAYETSLSTQVEGMLAEIDGTSARPESNPNLGPAKARLTRAKTLLSELKFDREQRGKLAAVAAEDRLLLVQKHVAEAKRDLEQFAKDGLTMGERWGAVQDGAVNRIKNISVSEVLMAGGLIAVCLVPGAQGACAVLAYASIAYVGGVATVVVVRVVYAEWNGNWADATKAYGDAGHMGPDIAVMLLTPVAMKKIQAAFPPAPKLPSPVPPATPAPPKPVTVRGVVGSVVGAIVRTPELYRGMKTSIREAWIRGKLTGATKVEEVVVNGVDGATRYFVVEPVEASANPLERLAFVYQAKFDAAVGFSPKGLVDAKAGGLFVPDFNVPGKPPGMVILPNDFAFPKPTPGGSFRGIVLDPTTAHELHHARTQAIDGGFAKVRTPTPRDGPRPAEAWTVSSRRPDDIWHLKSTMVASPVSQYEVYVLDEIPAWALSAKVSPTESQSLYRLARVQDFTRHTSAVVGKALDALPGGRAAAESSLTDPAARQRWFDALATPETTRGEPPLPRGGPLTLRAGRAFGVDGRHFEIISYKPARPGSLVRETDGLLRVALRDRPLVDGAAADPSTLQAWARQDAFDLYVYSREVEIAATQLVGKVKTLGIDDPGVQHDLSALYELANLRGATRALPGAPSIAPPPCAKPSAPPAP